MNRKAKLAKKTFDSLCAALDAEGYSYRMDEDCQTVFWSVKGDDLPMDLVAQVQEEPQLVVLRSRLPVAFPKDKRKEAAIVVGLINNDIVDGNFDFDIKTGALYFKMSNSFM